jgi:hypothetical protein
MDIHFKDLIDTPATSCASYSRQIAFTCHNDPPESATVLSSSCASCWSSQVAAHFTSIHLIYVVFVLDRLHRCDPTGFELVSSMSALWNPTRPSDPLWHCLVLGVNLQNMAGMNWKTLHRLCIQDAWCFYAQSSPFSLSVIPHFHGSKLHGVSTSFSPLTRVYEQHNSFVPTVLLGKYAAILYFLPLFEERRAYITQNSGICGYIIPPIANNLQQKI